jgi:hypothetical protein
MATERTVYWVQPGSQKGSWRVQKQGGSRASGTFEKKSEAITFAKEQAKKTGLGQVRIQNGEGRIEREFTYGKDPRSKKG